MSYPFGMQVPNRFYSASDYRYGFNGKEKDNEIKGDGNSIDYGFRMHDPRIGKFLSIDPLTKSYPWYSPYQFAGNTPIQAIDLDGLEEYHYSMTDNNGKAKLTLLRTYTRMNHYGLWGLIDFDTEIKVKRYIISYRGFTFHIGFAKYGTGFINSHLRDEFKRDYIDKVGEIMDFEYDYYTDQQSKAVSDVSIILNSQDSMADVGIPMGGHANVDVPDVPTSKSTTSTSKIQKVNGRLPINSKYAVKTFTFEASSALGKKYPKGVAFKEAGFPDFSAYARKTVDIKQLNKSSSTDISKANKAAGYDNTPTNHVWHHVEFYQITIDT